MKSMEISERIQKELPEVYIPFKNIANADPQDAYRMFKKVAEQTKKPWNCKTMEEFYAAG
jgi:hypothetical protein